MDVAAKRRAVKALVSNLASVSEKTQRDGLCQLRQLSKDDAESRQLIVDANAVPLIAESLYSSSPLMQENATATLLNLSIASKDHLMWSHGALDALSHALRNPASPTVAQCAAATIFSLLSSEPFRRIIGDKRDIVFGLLEIVKNKKSAPRSIKDAVCALFGIALYPSNRAQMVELGAVQALFSLMINIGRSGLIEDVSAVIAQIAGCEKSWEVFNKTYGVEVLMDFLDSAAGSSPRTKENAVSALLNLIQFGGKQAANDLRGRMQVGVYCSVVDVSENGSARGKNKARELLRLLDDTCQRALKSHNHLISFFSLIRFYVDSNTCNPTGKQLPAAQTCRRREENARCLSDPLLMGTRKPKTSDRRRLDSDSQRINTEPNTVRSRLCAHQDCSPIQLHSRTPPKRAQ